MLIKYEPTKTHQSYKTSNGVKVPGATTVLGVIDKSAALIHWAWKLGCEGQDYKKVRDKAAGIGTLAHFICECYLKGNEADLSEFSQTEQTKAKIAADKWYEWWIKSKLEYVGSELQLVSDTLLFGGTLDIIARDPDENYHQIDLKTSKTIYDSHWYQVAAYGKLWNEVHPGYESIKTYSICRIGKEDDSDDFEVVSRTSLDKEWEVFRAAHELYTALQKCKKKGE